MRKALFLMFILLATMPPAKSSAQTTQEQAGALGATVSGRWMVNADFYGTRMDLSLELKQDGEKLTGSLQGNLLEGTIHANALNFVAKNEQGLVVEANAAVQGNTISGALVFSNANDPQPPSRHQFIATLVPTRRTGAPQRYEFTPTVFYREFAAATKPVLTISPGDTIHTTTVDAGGTDERGVTRVLGGNPETGPFYVETAAPGDTLVVHLNRLRLNRDWAISDDALVERALDRGLAVKMKDGGKPVRWHLDAQRGLATVEKPGEHLVDYSVPLRPMLGCIAVAPPNSVAGLRTGDSEIIGGNMDFNEIVEGATVFLPVFVPRRSSVCRRRSRRARRWRTERKCARNLYGR